MPVPNRSEPDISHLADACLGYLSENPEELLGFMQNAGLDPQSLRAAIGTERMQHGLIDYFASNEPILLALCANQNITPEAFMRVWHRINRTEF
ncbi:DUF3572 family protein [Devosia aurantiaca]|uniref:DUF3572 domain-containing protein n=1 Tax=Devosia aurantiaca TaxID=2714858 RepID=A0A6M1SQC4_9HYPH|nr:DUF3572 family protein [Devosia aurantiaca]NGP17672.1 DUF3572 domain-containing protein [Devosia aurantiaca]